MIKNLIRKALNNFGYYEVKQLKVGGMCGCCGKKIPDLIWFDESDNWSDIGICKTCEESI